MPPPRGGEAGGELPPPGLATRGGFMPSPAWGEADAEFPPPGTLAPGAGLSRLSSAGGRLLPGPAATPGIEPGVIPGAPPLGGEPG